MAPWLIALIPSLAPLVGGLFGANAAGKAAKLSADASERNAETQRQIGLDNIRNLRDLYNIDLKLNWPGHRLATESMGSLARGIGSELPASAFETPDEPPALPEFAGGPGGGQHGDITSGFAVPREGEPGSEPGKGWERWAGLAAGGVGFLAGGKIGRGRREADQLVPIQEDLTRRILLIEAEVDRRIADGTMTDEDWGHAARAVKGMRDKYFTYTQDFQRAGPGGRRSIGDWVDPMLAGWGNKQSRKRPNSGGAGAGGRAAQSEPRPWRQSHGAE